MSGKAGPAMRRKTTGHKWKGYGYFEGKVDRKKLIAKAARNFRVSQGLG